MDLFSLKENEQTNLFEVIRPSTQSFPWGIEHYQGLQGIVGFTRDTL